MAEIPEIQKVVYGGLGLPLTGVLAAPLGAHGSGPVQGGAQAPRAQDLHGLGLRPAQRLSIHCDTSASAHTPWTH